MDSKSVFSEVNDKSLQPPAPDLEIGYNKLWWTKKKERKKQTKKKTNKRKTNSSGKTSMMFLRLHNKNSNK